MPKWYEALTQHHGHYAHHFADGDINATVVPTPGSQSDVYNCLTAADGVTPKTDLTEQQVSEHLTTNGVDPESDGWR